MVTFEVARVSAKGGHAHVQVVPIPESLGDKVGEAFVNEGKRMGLEPESDAQEALVACGDGKKSYFRVDLPDGRIMIWLFDGAGRSFSLQFGRCDHTLFFFLKGAEYCRLQDRVDVAAWYEGQVGLEGLRSVGRGRYAGCERV